MLEIYFLVSGNGRILEGYLIKALPQSDLDQNMPLISQLLLIHDENQNSFPESEQFEDLLMLSIMPPVPKHAGYSDCHPLAGD